MKTKTWEIGIYREVDDPRCAGNERLTVSGSMVEAKTLVIEKAPIDSLLDEVETTLQRRLKSDEDCGHSFDENLGELLNKIKDFR